MLFIYRRDGVYSTGVGTSPSYVFDGVKIRVWYEITKPYLLKIIASVKNLLGVDSFYQSG